MQHGNETSKYRQCQLEIEVWTNIQKRQKLASNAAYSVFKIAESAMTSKSKKDRKTALKLILTNSTDGLGFLATADVLRKE